MKEIIAWVPAWRILDDVGGFEECYLLVVPGERVPDGYHVSRFWEGTYYEVERE